MVCESGLSGKHQGGRRIVLTAPEKLQQPAIGLRMALYRVARAFWAPANCTELFCQRVALAFNRRHVLA